MILGMHATKLVVRDADAAERFYHAIGLKLASRNTGGEGEVRQKQAWLSVTGDSSSHMLILAQFTEIPYPAMPGYPGEVWLAFNVVDVEAVCEATLAEGGRVIRAGEDQPAYGVRAAVIADPEGHIIEIVGPMDGVSGSVAHPLAKGATQ